MIKLKDVADEVGVSVSLVSKVLNNRLGNAGARKELMEKIHETAEKMGYQRNQSASALVSKRQYSIAVFIHRTGSYSVNFVQELLEGISHATAVNNLRMILIVIENFDQLETSLRRMHKGVVDGVIFSGAPHPEYKKKLLEMQEAGLMVATVYSHALDPRIPNVGLDEAELAYLGVKRLIEKGCKSIAHFDVRKERTEGYRRALKEAGIKYNKSLVIHADAPSGFFYDAGIAMTKRLLEKGIHFDAISAQSDEQAFGAINELTRRGFRVPHDVMITGIDDTPSCELSIVSLTSVNQKYQERGGIAVELIEQSMANGDSTVDSVNISGRLVLRGSTGD